VQGRNDPVDDVLESLGGRPWPGDYDNRQLKEKIMQKCHTQSSRSSFRSRGALIATLAFVLLGAVGFTAAGGFEMIKGWIITAEVEGGGNVTIDEDDVSIETNDDGVTTITIDGAEVEGAEEGATVTITATSAGCPGGTVIVEQADGPTTGEARPELAPLPPLDASKSAPDDE